MKTLSTFIFLLFINFSSFCQTFKINVSEIRSYKSMGNLDYDSVVKKHYWDSGPEIVNCTYIFNMDKKTSTFYNEGFFVSTLKMDELNVVDGVYTFKVKDYNKYNTSEVINTVFVLDSNSKEFYMSWYRPNCNITRTQTHTKTKFIDPTQ